MVQSMTRPFAATAAQAKAFRSPPSLETPQHPPHGTTAWYQKLVRQTHVLLDLTHVRSIAANDSRDTTRMQQSSPACNQMLQRSR